MIFKPQLCPVCVEHFVTRLLIIFCDFKKFIDKAKSIIKTHVMSDRPDFRQ